MPSLAVAPFGKVVRFDYEDGGISGELSPLGPIERELLAYAAKHGTEPPLAWELSDPAWAFVAEVCVRVPRDAPAPESRERRCAVLSEAIEACVRLRDEHGVAP